MQPCPKIPIEKSQMNIPKVFKGDPSDDTLPYRKWFHSVENYMKWHRTDSKDDMDKIIWIGGVMDGNAGTLPDARAEYMEKYFNVDEWNPFVSAMAERFLDRQQDRKALGKMRELKYRGDIESYLMDMETFNYKVCLVGTAWRTLLRYGLGKDLQYRLSTPKRDPRNDIDYVASICRIGLVMEEFLMLPRKHSSKDNSSSLKKKDKKRKRQEEGDQREDKPRDSVSDGSKCPGRFPVGFQPGTELLQQVSKQNLLLKRQYFLLQLTIWVLIVSQHDQYVDCAILVALSSPSLRFAIRQVLVGSQLKTHQFRSN